MLKIKDNVDLKELEKFGFKEYDNCPKTRSENLQIEVNTTKTDKRMPYKKITITTSYHRCILKDTYDVLYDLIQAGLVEKVEE